IGMARFQLRFEMLLVELLRLAGKLHRIGWSHLFFPLQGGYQSCESPCHAPLYMLRRLNLLDLACRQTGLVLVPIHRWSARVDLLHTDAAFNGADQAAQVAANAGVLLDREDVDRVAARPGQYL